MLQAITNRASGMEDDEVLLASSDEDVESGCSGGGSDAATNGSLQPQPQSPQSPAAQPTPAACGLDSSGVVAHPLEEGLALEGGGGGGHSGSSSGGGDAGGQGGAQQPVVLLTEQQEVQS